MISPIQHAPKKDKLPFLTCNVAAFSHYKGEEIFDLLKIGKKIRLIREADNKYDHNAVMVFFGDTHIGYIPRQLNSALAKLLDMGYADCFEARIKTVDPNAYPEQQIEIIIYLKRKEI